MISKIKAAPPINDELKAFLKAWYEWATNGAPEYNHYGFKRVCGLCAASHKYDIEGDVYFELYTLLQADFKNFSYPFGGEDLFHLETRNKTKHLNPQRLEWVRSKIDE